jgi:hypothetical protein
MADTFSLFGYSLVKKKTDAEIEQNQKSFVPKSNEDGSAVIAASGSMGAYVDFEGTMRSEAENIDRYRAMALTPEIDQALSEIVNEAICVDEHDVVKLDLDDLDGKASDEIKEEIQKAFDEILNLLEFNEKGYYIFQRSYVDGRLNYHTVIDTKNPEAGIQELRYIDPRKIRKIREIEVINQVTGSTTVPIQRVKAEYYMYNENGFSSKNQKQSVGYNNTSMQGLKIATDAVVSINSGLTDESGTEVLSHLHKAIKPLNILRAIEDACVIYRLARAAERRVWYIDVGNMPAASAEKYVKGIMDSQKTSLAYNTADGSYVDKRKFQTLLEDYYLPRKEGSRGTEVETLPSAQNLSQMDDVEYFQKKLYNALSVPITRLQPGDAFTIGRATEVTRDEVSFGKFIVRLRTRFSGLFTQLLQKQLVLKQIMSVEDFKKLAPLIKYTYSNDNYFMEMKESEVNQNRLELLTAAAPYVGRYYSNKWVIQNILRQTEEEAEDMRLEIEDEQTDPIFSQPMPGQGMDGMDPMMQGMGPDELPTDDPDGNGIPGDQGGGVETQAAQPNQQFGKKPPFGGQNGQGGFTNEQPKIQQIRDFKRKKKPQVSKEKTAK